MRYTAILVISLMLLAALAWLLACPVGTDAATEQSDPATSMAAKIQEVSFESSGQSLFGDLWLPDGELRAIVVFVHGSGPAARDGYGLFPPIRKAFAQAGIGSLAWDKPGIGKSPGDWKAQTMEDRIIETTRAVRFVQKRTNAKPAQIGLWGISQAGWVMPAVTAEVRAGFCIGVSVPGGTIASQDRFQQEQKIRASQLTEEDKSEATILVGKRDELARQARPYEEVALLQNEARKQPWSSIVDNLDSGDYRLMVSTPSPVRAVARMSCPIQLIFGALDQVVDRNETVAAYRQALGGRADSVLTVEVIENADHAILPSKTGTMTETNEKVARQEIEYPPKYIDSMAQWITLQVDATGRDEWIDKSPHKSEYLTANNVSLHYLDWGGKGQTILFLHGAGDTAHIFDDLAPKFTNQFRVLGLTRRGHGQSGKPEAGYDTATLVEDIRQFLDVLKVQRAILVGHSIAGDELTRFAGEHPDRVIKLVYLDAAYDRARLSELHKQLPPELSSTDTDKESRDSFRRWVSRVSFWSDAWEANLREMTVCSPDGTILRWAMPDEVSDLLMQGTIDSHPDYSKIRSPALNIAAVGFSSKVSDMFKVLPDPARTRAEDGVTKFTQFQQEEIERFRKHIPNGRVVELTDTDHHCFIQRESEVVREMREFLAQ